MPRLTVWTVRASLVCLVLGALLGAALLAVPPLDPPVAASLARLAPVHVELLLVGWLVQLALGVAYWILPRAGGRRPAARVAGSGAAALASGVGCAAAGALAGGGWVVVAGRSLEVVGAALFGVHVTVRLSTWKRLDARRRREASELAEVGRGQEGGGGTDA
ncbi:MAG: hypothetical protein Q8W51_05100 [Candidatus Palauibacterales bacterium]|nr:hypothetical protein [Candidatus Palauibacterales bacterium]MDP2529093.1 hypothetical protein [Candidatus Palauibacterales bacterium]MDP2584283.1 hypothetical protein [Candidatus Palauibacterales bacterium]